MWIAIDFILSSSNQQETKEDTGGKRMHGIGKIKSLQGLDGFYVKNEIGYKIGETFPPFGQLPFLKSLKFDRMLRMKWLESRSNGNDAYYSSIELELFKCPKLKELPALPPKLKTIHITLSLNILKVSKLSKHHIFLSIY
ncbi:hypothetical protein IEQ34_020652 [Dendrobium chrysotoxum]|uniref:Uncharacterized protein n=1 Tax=Dendrobium chrysotoxum TaxID=161865 RepID=A0AAV7G2K3_DENCH|nr:hypothetical protein IEQ34_020652 [Dendrobium chrysotoxum]